LRQRARQSGNALVTSLLALVLLGVTAAAKLNQDIATSQRNVGLTEASLFQTIGRAGQSMIDDQLLNMLNGASLTRNAVTIPLALVNGVPTYTISMANLATMGYTPAGFAVPTSLANGQPYRMRITRLPVGCVFPNCTIEGLIWIDGPILGTRNLAGTVNGNIVGAMLTQLGANGGVSLATNAANIAGFGNSWVQANPVAGTPPGVVALRFDGMYMPDLLRVGDTRDPALLGDLTVAGNIAGGGTLTAAGATTLNNTLTVAGATNLGTTATIGGNTTVGGTLTVNGAGGVTINGANGVAIGACARVDGATGRGGFACQAFNDLPAGYTGGVRTVDMVASGNVLASDSPSTFTGNNTNFALMTSNTGAGRAGVRTSGTVAADRLSATGVYVPGTACTEEGSIARSSTANGLVACQNLVWKAFLVDATLGAACTVNGQLASNAAGVSLFCQQGSWVFTADRFGRFAVTDTYSVVHGSTVPIPTCPSDGVAKIYINPQGIDTRPYGTTTPYSGANNFRASTTVSPGNYTIYVDDTVTLNAPLGTATSGYGLAVVGCFYN
jgi:hypothetical protein